MSALPVQQVLLTEDEARHLTDQIRETAEQLWSLLLEAHERQAWRALGYQSWSAYIDGEFSFGRNYAYRLVSQGRVIREIQEVLPYGNTPEVTEAVARDIKPHLEAVKDEIRERVGAGEDGRAVASEVIQRTRDEAREHEGMVRRFRKGLDQFSIGWIYIRDIGQHEHRDEILAGADPMTREAVEEFEAQYGRYVR